LAYLRAYRRERGPETPARLLDAASLSRSRPAVREVTLLLRHGFGRRVAEFGRRAFVVAAFAAVLGGLSGIAFGSWLAWRNVNPMAPDKTTTIGLVHTVPPSPFDGRVDYYGQHTFWNRTVTTSCMAASAYAPAGPASMAPFRRMPTSSRSPPQSNSK
jgi:hypothetical protein